jgi:antitoxin VapB
LIDLRRDELRIRPARRSLSDVMERFARFSPDFVVKGGGKQTQQERDVL